MRSVSRWVPGSSRSVRPDRDRVGIDQLRALHVVQRHRQARDGTGAALASMVRPTVSGPSGNGWPPAALVLAPVARLEHTRDAAARALDARQVDPGARPTTARRRARGTAPRPPPSGRPPPRVPARAGRRGCRAAAPRPCCGSRRAPSAHRPATTSRILPRHFFWNSASPTASTSSTIRISGSRCAATAKASRTYMPLE